MIKGNIVFSKPSCPYCVKAKDLLKKVGVAFEEKILGTDITPDQLFEQFDSLSIPRPRSAPQIFLNGNYVGGYDQLVTYVEEHGMEGPKC